MPKLMFIAGENSGDQHAANFMRELKLLIPDLEMFGYGGERMEAQGMRLDFNLAQKLPIIGFTQALKNYGKLKKLLERAGEMLKSERPDAIVLVDYPGFNLRVAALAKEAGVPVIYYISPQIWAWHKSRLKKIASTVSHMMVILPFEQELYSSAGVPVTYVGHPLQDVPATNATSAEARRSLGFAEDDHVIGLIPGSRNSEVVRHMELLLESAKLIKVELPQTKFLIPRAGTISRELLDKYLKRFPDVTVTVEECDTKLAQKAMTFAVCKSGTSTLELALADIPMVVIYKVSWLTYLLAKALVQIKWIGLVNIVAGEEVAPELVQLKASPGNIAGQVTRYLKSPGDIARMREGLASVRAKIGNAGASEKAAQVVRDLLLSKV